MFKTLNPLKKNFFELCDMALNAVWKQPLEDECTIHIEIDMITYVNHICRGYLNEGQVALKDLNSVKKISFTL